MARVTLEELRSAGFTVTVGADRKRRPTFSVEPASKLSPPQRRAVKASQCTIRLELEMEAIEARVWDPADGLDPDAMFGRWIEDRIDRMEVSK